MAKAVLSKAYNPKLVEDKWYTFWLKNKYFHAKVDQAKKPFSIVIPPPNITGSLHMGHALNNTLQDIIVRKKRMEGYVTLWLPGTDHAGIATQNVVEQQLAREGLDRKALGREKFIERVWEWKEKYGQTIINQLKRLGCSCDWDRERFTLDEGYSTAVRKVFVQLYKEGLIYQGNYIINWCPRCQTALSDIEVEHEDVEGHLWYIKYFFKDSDEYLVVATTRPETMLGDTAVAVNPTDKRYQKFVGRTLILPLLNRELPLISDRYVDPSFGTGVVKVTPAHDPNDFEIGLRHDLPQVNIFTEEAKLNKEVGPYEGLDRYEGREAVLKDLEKGGYLVKVQPHLHAIGHCYRCHTVVEPYLSNQWFVKMKPIAELAISVVREARIRFIPKRWEKIYFDWMENIRDWCISRQIWWGHRIPAWHCRSCGETIVEEETPTSCPKCGSKDIDQETDVLDTWFSSALWPFATLGWPDKTKDLAYFYPTSLLSTAFDIIYFWVARMIMMGLYFINDIPFREVYFHALIRDVLGRKMSKSRGNVIDPLEVIEWSGTDALRFTLASLAVPGRDVLLSEDRIEGYRHFANKIWNASRFVLMNLDGYDKNLKPSSDDLAMADRWILSRLNEVISDVDKDLESYNFSEACRTLYNFFWGEYCDWYIEWTKERLQQKQVGARQTAQHVLIVVLDNVLRLLHPIMPFITEEIWQKLPTAGESIVIAPWPQADLSLVDKEAESAARLMINATNAIRQIRHDLHISPDKKLRAVMSASHSSREVLTSHESYLKFLGRLSDISWLPEKEDLAKAVKAVVSDVEIFLPLAGVIDIKKEQARLSQEIEAIIDEMVTSERKLANEGFVSKAPAEIIEKEKSKVAYLRSKKRRLEDQLKLLEQ